LHVTTLQVLTHFICSLFFYSFICLIFFFSFFFFNAPATTEIYTLSLHDALPILDVAEPLGERLALREGGHDRGLDVADVVAAGRSEEHTSELQSPCNLVCRLLLEKKKKKIKT